MRTKNPTERDKHDNEMNNSDEQLHICLHLMRNSIQNSNDYHRHILKKKLQHPFNIYICYNSRYSTHFSFHPLVDCLHTFHRISMWFFYVSKIDGTSQNKGKLWMIRACFHPHWNLHFLPNCWHTIIESNVF